MKHLFICVLLLSVSACNQSPEPTIVATYSGGRVTLGQVEQVLLSLPADERMSQELEIVEGYRAIARRIALTRILVPETADPQTRFEALNHERPSLFRREVVRRFFLTQISDSESFAVGDEEARQYFQEHPGQFVRPPRRLLYHIFRWAAEDGSTDDAVRLLKDLGQRAVRGEDIELLAREYSQSETRSIGGKLGWIDRGLLPPEIEEIAFNLNRGEASEPFPVPGGVNLFFVGESVEEKAYDFDDVKRQIRRTLTSRNFSQALVAAGAEIPNPEGAIVHDREALVEILKNGDDEDPVLKIEDTTTRGEFLKALAQEVRPKQGPIWEDQAWSLYQQLVGSCLLYDRAQTTGFLDRPEVRRQIENDLRAVVDQELVDTRIMDVIRNDRDGLDLSVRVFFEENRQRYQSPLRFRARILVVSDLVDPDSQMRQLVEAKKSLAAGDESLEEVAQRVGGKINELKWLDFQQLHQINPKVARFLVELQAKDFSVPYQLAHSLQIIEMLERKAPQELTFDQAYPQVLEDYITRFRDTLYEEAISTILERGNFRFLEENVQLALQPPEPISETEK